MARDGKPAILPESIVSPTDVARLAREIKDIDNFFQQQKIRQAGQTIKLPRLSANMDVFATENMLNLLEDNDREKALELLSWVHEKAPVIHMSFSIDPPGAYVQKIVSWMRSNLDGSVLVTVGLQPNIGAGCVMRTTNKIFDFSLREYFSAKREHFIQKLHDIVVDDAEEKAVEATIAANHREQQTVDVSEPSTPEEAQK